MRAMIDVAGRGEAGNGRILESGGGHSACGNIRCDRAARRRRQVAADNRGGYQEFSPPGSFGSGGGIATE